MKQAGCVGIAFGAESGDETILRSMMKGVSLKDIRQATMMAGQAGRFDLFTKLEHRDFPGGRMLRTPLLVLGMLWYRVRDLL